ncbi:hypothetical protein RFA54_001581 [Vibrio vulnificus]|nr:hypothetical protein [Vibrio vulnificus]
MTEFRKVLPTSMTPESQIIQAYKSLRSFAGIAMTTQVQPVQFTVVSGGAGATNIMHLNIADSGGEVRGNAFTGNSDGTITVNKSMFAAVVNICAIARFASNDNVVVGIGIGDPLQIPSSPGVQVGENYVSRFRCARVGDGSGDEVTWDLHATPVGKSTTAIEVFGLKQGDKVFPVIWTQEADDALIEISELIFTVEEISA